MAYKPGALKIIGWVIKAILYMTVVFVLSMLIWRMCFSTRIPEKIKQIYVTPSLTAAYADGSIEGFNQDQASITREDQCYGYFSVEDYVIISEASQVQIIFRYNNSTVKNVANDYGLSRVPSPDEEMFDVTLVKTTDMTPDNPDDNIDESALAKTRYFPSEVVTERTKLYNYRRFVFEGVDIGELDIGLFVDIYYLGDLDYESTPLGTLCLYDYQMERIDYRFSGADLKRIENGKEN